jgi:DcmR-like sensory protein
MSRNVRGIADVEHHHAVQFYRDEASLFSTVATFLSEGLIARQPAIVIATEAHRKAIVEHLCGRLIDCDSALRKGRLVLLDAEDTLGLFMIDGSPNPKLFAQAIEPVIEGMLVDKTQSVIRAYGEMVDVLWKRGESDTAIKLEILWNKLALKYRFALLCGYAMGSFYKQSKQMAEVRAQHSHVVKPHTHVVPFTRTRGSARVPHASSPDSPSR